MNFFTKMFLVVALLVPGISFAQVVPTTDTDVETQTSCVELTRFLTYTSRDSQTGGDVTRLQNFLIDGKYLVGRATGYFGQGTLAAVKNFQVATGLATAATPGYGGIGARSRAKIKEISCAGATVQTPTTPVVVVPPTPPVAPAVPTPAVTPSTPTTTTPTTTSDKPVVTFLTAPWLSLQYDAYNKESTLVATARVFVKTGSSFMYTGNVSNLLAIGAADGARIYTNSTKQAISSSWASKTIIPANSEGTFVVTVSIPTKELFAGSYQAQPGILMYTDSRGVDYQIVDPSFSSVGVSKAVRIMGETSPHITGVTSDATPDVNISITGVRFNPTANSVTIAGITKVLPSTNAGTMISFTARAFGLTSAGDYYVQIKDPITGSSNKFNAPFHGFASSADVDPKLTILEAPSLNLSYGGASGRDEVTLTETIKARITAGRNASIMPQSDYAPILFRLFNITRNERADVVMKPTDASRQSLPTLIPAGQSADYTVQYTVNPKDLFAGQYRLEVLPTISTRGADGSWSFPNLNMIGAATSNILTIIGETSPYITSVAYDATPDVNIVITGVRFSPTANTVTIGGFSKILPSTNNGTVISLTARSLGLTTAQEYYVLVKDTTTGAASNTKYLPFHGLMSNADKLRADLATATTLKNQCIAQYTAAPIKKCRYGGAVGACWGAYNESPTVTCANYINNVTSLEAALNSTMQTSTTETPTVSMSVTPAPQKIIAGSAGVTFANIQIDATSLSADSRVSSLTVIKTGLSGLSGCQFFDGATALKTGPQSFNPSDLTPDTILFDPVLTVARNTVKTLTLKCNVAASAKGSFYFTVTGINNNMQGGSSSSAAMTVSGVSGSLNISTSPSSPTYKLAIAGSQDEVVGIVRLRATDEAMNLNTVTLKLSYGNAAGLSAVSLWDGPTFIGRAMFTSASNTATSQISVTSMVLRDIDKDITIKASFSPIGVGQAGTEGDLIKIDVVGVAAVGAISGNSVSSTGAMESLGVRVFKSYPAVFLDSLSTSGLVDGNLMKFKIGANSGNGVSLSKLTFVVKPTSSIVNVTNVNLFAYSDPGYTQPIPGFVTGQVSTRNISPVNNMVAITPSNGTLVIPAGAIYYFKLVGTVAGVSSGAGVVTTLLGDNTYPAPGSATMRTYDAVALSNNFVWSPNTTGLSSTSSSDWTNGYTVPGLPSTGLTSSRFATATSGSSQMASVIGAFMGDEKAAPAQAAATSSFGYNWARNLELGSRYTADVKALQTALTKEGVFSGEVTGGFYNQTYLAVKAFQAKYGIEASGFVGPETRAKLNSLYVGGI